MKNTGTGGKKTVVSPTAPEGSLGFKVESEKERLERLKKAIEAVNKAIKSREEKKKKRPSAIDALLEPKTDIDSLFELPMDWSNPYTDSGFSTERIYELSDALVKSLCDRGRVDVEYISALSDTEPLKVISQLRGSIYQNPETWSENILEGWETAEEYLSGNLSRKLRVAKSAAKKYGRHFDINVEGIKAVLPPRIAAEDIYVALGSPWLPTDVIDDFIVHLINSKTYTTPSGGVVKHDELTGVWEVPYKTRFDYTRHSTKCYSTYGTSDVNMLALIEHALNMRTVTVTKSVPSALTKSGVVSVVDKEKTLLALEKLASIEKAFAKWIWKDEERRERLRAIYEERYGAIRTRHFDGSFLTLPGINPEIELYPYQKNAVARIILTPNTLLAHDVGSGKTLEMIAAGMEMRRMGISKKNMYVVPPTLVGQWKEMFERLYPAASVLVVNNKNFSPEHRLDTLTKMRDGDYDGIIIAYSCFDMIPLSNEYYEKLYENALSEIDEAMRRLRSGSSLVAKERAIRKSLEKLKAAESPAGEITFDTLGVSTLFVDEAHNYKNVPTDTRITRIPGISRQGSQKCASMMEKVHFVQKSNGGRGVVLATGTPITNSITDVFVLQRYLQSGELRLLGLNSFDSWVGMFAEKVTDFEIDVDTSSYRLATRFSRFHNLPELTGIFASVADFHKVGAESGIPETDGYRDLTITPNKAFTDYLGKISERADAVRGGKVARDEDNMLKITTDGRKAALDLRLVSPEAHRQHMGKVETCAERVAEIYERTKADKSAQLVFCDTSTPKEEFNVYDELADILTSRYSIPREEIAYVHDATTDKKRSELFSSVRRGDVRVLIGSTFKLGLGVNVQERLIALHHLDVPWRPADMVQREGRILRQGNLNKKVEIYRYVTKGSFDAYSWQLLETKQRFISQLLSGVLYARDGQDVDGTVLSYSEIKALAVGNPLIKKRVEASNELARLLLLNRKRQELKQAEGQERMELPEKIVRQRRLLWLAEEDCEIAKANPKCTDKEEQVRLREKIYASLYENAGSPVEKMLLVYRGFRIIAPAYMTPDRTYVYLERGGRYYLELGSEAGVLRRIDFFLDEMSRQVEKYRDTLEKYIARSAALDDEDGDGEEDYESRISDLRATIEKIDKKLGAKK